MKRVLFFIFAVCWTLFMAGRTATAQAPAPKYYCNVRFGFCIEYDPALLLPMPEAQNGDGRIYKDRKGAERLSVYGSGDWNFGQDGEVIPLSALYKKEISKRENITYKVLGKNSFTISGRSHGEIYYLKVVKRKDAFCKAYLHYLPAENEKYKGMTSLIAKTFR